MNGAVKMVLDVEKENLQAIKLYKQLGYGIIHKSLVRLGKGVFVDSYD